MKRIGITGTIGAGKSTLCALLRANGYEVFDSDAYCHHLLEDKEVAQEICTELNVEVRRHGQIDRGRLAAVVFQNEDARKKLNALIHPLVRTGLREFFRDHETEFVAFAEVPLLFEARMEDEFDLIAVVTSEEDTALQRLCAYRGFTMEQAKARIARQIDPCVQIAKADVVFHNDGTVEDLKKQVAAWLKEVES